MEIHETETEYFPDDDLAVPHPERFACLQLLTGQSAGLVFRLLSEETSVGRSHGADFCINDRSISRLHARLEMQDDGSCRIIDLDSTNGTWVNNERVTSEGHRLDDGDRVRFGTAVVARFSWQDGIESNLHARLYETATKDGLTGATSRTHFLERYEEELDLARRGQIPLSVLMIDIDHFKRVNDTFGHLAGDRVLATLVERVVKQLRSQDHIARYGGEEFIHMARLSSEEAMHLGERLRAAVQDKPFLVPGPEIEQEITVTISVGVATWTGAARNLIQEADRALYTAKNSGRNRVVSSAAPEP